MKPYPFAALNHFTTPCSLLNFFTPRRDLRHLPGVTPVGGARNYPGDGPLHHYGITRPNQMRRHAGTKLPALSRAFVGHRAIIASRRLASVAREEMSSAGGSLILQVGGGVRLAAQLFRHDQFRAALRRAAHLKFVHESAHQENSPPGSLQKILFRKRVRHLTDVKAAALIDNVHHELVVGYLEVELNLFVPLLFVSVAEGVDHALPHGHGDFQTIVLVEAGRSGHALGYAFGQGHAVEQRLHGHFDAVGGIRHSVISEAESLRSIAHLQSPPKRPPLLGNAQSHPIFKPNRCGRACGIEWLRSNGAVRFLQRNRDRRWSAPPSESGRAPAPRDPIAPRRSPAAFRPLPKWCSTCGSAWAASARSRKRVFPRRTFGAGGSAPAPRAPAPPPNLQWTLLRATLCI